MTNVGDETLGKIARQQYDLFRRVREGSLDSTLVGRALQDIIDGKFSPMTWEPPTWWRTPKQQLERARQLWPDAVLPEPPAEFSARTKSEVLLLHVPDSFESLWGKVVAPEGCSTYRSDVTSDEGMLRLSPGKHEFTEPVWLVFDPEYGNDVKPSLLWGLPSLAASEVFSALIQFPDWSLWWLEAASAPCLSGYQLKHYDDWSLVPSLYQRDRSGIGLVPFAADQRDYRWASPSVRVPN